MSTLPGSTEAAALDGDAGSVPPAVALRNISFVYLGSSRRGGGEPAVDDLSLDVAEGSSVGLLGPNGSGKSTLMKILSGLLRPDRGTVRIGGQPQSAAARQSLGVVFQGLGLDRHLSVYENLCDSARLQGLSSREARERVVRGLRQAGLSDRSSDLVKTLSGGLARRADLCRALIPDPALLLLDEPTGGLDPSARRAFLDLVESRRRATGMTVVMSTHLVDEAERQERIVMLHRGSIVADDTPDALRRQAGAMRLTIHDPAWKPPASDESWRQVSGLWGKAIESDELSKTAVLTAELTREGVSFSMAPPTLADVFELFTGATLDDPAPQGEGLTRESAP